MGIFTSRPSSSSSSSSSVPHAPRVDRAARDQRRSNASRARWRSLGATFVRLSGTMDAARESMWINVMDVI